MTGILKKVFYAVHLWLQIFPAEDVTRDPNFLQFLWNDQFIKADKQMFFASRFDVDEAQAFNATLRPTEEQVFPTRQGMAKSNDQETKDILSELKRNAPRTGRLGIGRGEG